mmetsp:Transcript_59815/g.117554  ORF Transcript_59815/g.117554 Transcript_59815/m.117554 type:complete len:246 (-) Transcript_59815:148-885(-)
MKLVLAAGTVALAQASSLLLRGRSSATLLAKSEAHEPGDRLAEDCEEPEGFGETYSGGMGPEKIFCCKTAQHVVQKLTNRCEKDCKDDVPCWKTLEEKWCGLYMSKYKEMEAKVCEPRPTTTTTTTTTIATTTTTVTTNEGATTTTTADPLEWCYKLCGEVAQSNKCKDEQSCKTFCRKAAEGFAKHGNPAADGSLPSAEAPEGGGSAEDAGEKAEESETAEEGEKPADGDATGEESAAEAPSGA